jgi:hypothetical protein
VNEAQSNKGRTKIRQGSAKRTELLRRIRVVVGLAENWNTTACDAKEVITATDSSSPYPQQSRHPQLLVKVAPNLWHRTCLLAQP